MRSARRTGWIVAVGVGAALVLTPVAVATFSYLHVDHDPPVLRIDDTEPMNHDNILEVTATPRRIVVHHFNPPATKDEECMDNDGSSLHMRCRTAGIERVEIKLRAGTDQLTRFDLSPDHVDLGQTARGGPGEDNLTGGSGRQRLFGERGADVLEGEAGPDLLDGGPGIDVCTGGPGPDELIDCE